MKKTYYISYNNKNIPYSSFSNSKLTKNKNYFNSNQINNIRSQIIPKTNFKYNNIYMSNIKNYKNTIQLYNNPKYPSDLLINKIKNIQINKSQSIPKNKISLYNYSGHLNKNNNTKYNRNLLSLTQEVMNYSNKNSNIKPFKSYNNYNLNFNYEDNINNDNHPNFLIPTKEIKFTYFINSRYN